MTFGMIKNDIAQAKALVGRRVEVPETRGA